ncbi:hypothetical protein I7I48_03116 [Histoplasma ohiense]|nr:hypothetical protein I7I48_03116 [Histoplasma ohiense (nom. inval.)]
MLKQVLRSFIYGFSKQFTPCSEVLQIHEHRSTSQGTHFCPRSFQGQLRKVREWRIGRAVVGRGAEQVSVLFHELPGEMPGACSVSSLLKLMLMTSDQSGLQALVQREEFSAV